MKLHRILISGIKRFQWITLPHNFPTEKSKPPQISTIELVSDIQKVITCHKPRTLSDLFAYEWLMISEIIFSRNNCHRAAFPEMSSNTCGLNIRFQNGQSCFSPANCISCSIFECFSGNNAHENGRKHCFQLDEDQGLARLVVSF